MTVHTPNSCHSEARRARQFTIRNGRIDVWAGHYPAVILHPSLGCPLIVEDPAGISLFLLADRNFREAFLKGNGHDGAFAAAGGANVRQIVNQHLKIHPWETVNENRRDLQVQDQPLFTSGAQHHIACFYLGKLGEELHDKESRHFANLRASTCSQFASMGLDEVFQIQIADYPFAPESLYDAYWAVLRNQSSLTTEQLYLDFSDLSVQQFVGKTWRGGRGADRNHETKAEGPLCAFQVDGQNGVSFTPDPSVPLQSRHPIVIPAAGKERLNLGHLSDVHLSSRQHAYKGKQATVIPGVDASDSPTIGDLANNNADNLFDLLTQFGEDPQVDLLVITGDLYDHVHNFDPAARETATTGQLWEAMYVDSIKAVRESAAEYPYGIDGLAVYSLLVYFYTRYRKPVMLVSGNHEAYEYPYGISPRVLGKRANDGIPLDHNLTFYEAILLYGPAYDKVIPQLNDWRANFKPDNFDWFSTVFSPLSDIVQTFRDQTLIAVQWGEGEDFLMNPTPVPGLNEGGTLPRATKSIDASQRRLIDTALDQASSQKIFCSHFTLINYAMDVPLEQSGRVGLRDNNYSRYEHGTTKSGREMLHGQWLANNRFQLALSGHSHRVGLYRSRYVAPQQPLVQHAGNDAYRQLGASMSATNEPAHLRTRGYHPADPATQNVAWGDSTRVFVTASAGPIPKQNLHGEMSGQGMEYPSAGKIVFGASGPEISLVKSRKETAKPRFAVACDYIDLMEDGFWEHFKAVGGDGGFEMKICWDKILPNFPDEKKGEFIESVTLWLVGDDGATDIVADSKTLHANTMRFGFSSDLQSQIEFFGSSLGAMFLSIKFSASALSHLPGFKDYDYASRWNIQVGIYDTLGRDVVPEKQEKGLFGKVLEKSGITKASTDTSSWQIMRHKKFGEVPSFLFRYRKYRSEFNNNLDNLPQ